MKLKLLAFAFILAFAISTFGALGASGVSAGGPILETGINSPQGSRFVNGPDAACAGTINAFTHVTGNGVEIDNLDVNFGPCFGP